jgi:rare lipoprotein A
VTGCAEWKHSSCVGPGVKIPKLPEQHGIASIYTGRQTASGQRFSAGSLCAAHRTWPMGTKVRVTHMTSGRQVVVRINDRGPFIRGRIIDLTPAAASAIGLTRRQGITKVRIERLN